MKYRWRRMGRGMRDRERPSTVMVPDVGVRRFKRARRSVLLPLGGR